MNNSALYSARVDHSLVTAATSGMSATRAFHWSIQGELARSARKYCRLVSS